MRELALFAGAGGGILGGLLLGWRTVCAVELDPYCRSILLARQRDGILPRFPVWDDVRTFDGKPWRGDVDVVSGGFPCQDISCAGKGAGIGGERSGLWMEMARIVCEVRPRFVFVENSPMLLSRGLGRVLGDLAAMGYDARWGVLGAAEAGAPHKRARIWLVANAGKVGHECSTTLPELGRLGFGVNRVVSRGWEREPSETPRESESRLGRMADGLAVRMDRLAAIGNGQVPAVVRLAWTLLGGPMTCPAATDARRLGP